MEKENIIKAICITLDDWRCDQYRWVNQGVTKLPRKDPKIRKLYFDSDTPNGPSKDFQRHAYQLLSDKTLTVIHYLGDESASVDFCHRSATKHLDQAFKRTCPSQLKMFEQLCTSDKANIVYKREVASLNCNPEHVAVQAPRNMKQLRNLRFQQMNQLRISRDALYNLHEIAYDVPGFTRKITTFPDLVCVCGLQVSNILLFKHAPSYVTVPKFKHAQQPVYYNPF